MEEQKTQYDKIIDAVMECKKDAEKALLSGNKAAAKRVRASLRNIKGLIKEVSLTLLETYKKQ